SRSRVLADLRNELASRTTSRRQNQFRGTAPAAICTRRDKRGNTNELAPAAHRMLQSNMSFGQRGKQSPPGLRLIPSWIHNGAAEGGNRSLVDRHDIREAVRLRTPDGLFRWAAGVVASRADGLLLGWGALRPQQRDLDPVEQSCDWQLLSGQFVCARKHSADSYKSFDWERGSTCFV